MIPLDPNHVDLQRQFLIVTPQAVDGTIHSFYSGSIYPGSPLLRLAPQITGVRLGSVCPSLVPRYRSVGGSIGVHTWYIPASGSCGKPNHEASPIIMFFFKGIPLKYHQWAGWWPWIYHITKHIIIQLRMEFRQVIKEPWATPSMATPESCYHVKNEKRHNFQRQSKNQKNLQKINPTIQTEAQNLNPKTI